MKARTIRRKYLGVYIGKDWGTYLKRIRVAIAVGHMPNPVEGIIWGQHRAWCELTIGHFPLRRPINWEGVDATAWTGPPRIKPMTPLPVRLGWSFWAGRND
jgi:hypothetical protein